MKVAAAVRIDPAGGLEVAGHREGLGAGVEVERVGAGDGDGE